MSDYLNSTRRSIAWLKQAHDAGQLEMKPPFQRNPVWTEAQKSFLIDSVLRGYPIPELYMQETVTEDGKERHIVVDGQQRVRACLEFIEGRFTLDPVQVPQWPDLKFEELTPEDRKKIYAYNFIARQLPPVPDEELRIVFQRLNRNTVMLNGQELRHATYWGEFIKCMEGLAELDWWSTSGIFTANDVRRMLDIEFISEIAVAYLHGPQNKKASLDKWYAAYERDFPDRSRVMNVFRVVLGELSHVLSAISTTRWRKKSDFYTLFLVVAAHENELPLARTARQRAATLLRQFGDAVDTYLSKGNQATVQVKKYADAVARAACDLANRKDRADALESYLKAVWAS
jgi:hypothetical protein